MNRKELKIKLNELNIPEHSYSLYGGVDILKTILEWGNKWRIHEIDERGNDLEIAVFNTEEEACEYFLKIMEKHSKIIEESYRKKYIPPKDIKRTFIASNSGSTTIDNDKASDFDNKQ